MGRIDLPDVYRHEDYPSEDEQVHLAVLLARAAHRGQTRKDGTPEFDHALRVASKVSQLGCHEYIVGVLHDVIEDSTVDKLALEALFGSEIATDVDTVSRRGLETYAEFIERISRGSTVAIIVKLADLEDNLNGQKKQSRRKRYEKARARLEHEMNLRDAAMMA